MKAKAMVLLVALSCLAAGRAAGQTEAPVPRGFRGIELGMDMAQVKERLLADALFGYRGEPDVSLLPTPQQSLIECTGSSFVRRSFFQFHESRLFVLILVLDPARLDYYTLFTTLGRKYGDSTRLDPSEAVWEFPGVRLSLERPLSVKYIDTAVFDTLREQGQAQQTLFERSRQSFLEEF